MYLFGKLFVVSQQAHWKFGKKCGNTIIYFSKLSEVVPNISKL